MNEDFKVTVPIEGKPWDVVIIGSGPAAFSAAIYTTRGDASTLILGGESWGGQLMLTTKVDNYAGFPEGVDGPELMDRMRKQAERFGTVFVSSYVTKVDFSSKPFKLYTGEKEYLAKSVLVATGAETLWLKVPGEKELIGRGVSSCAPCDAPFFKNRKVAVVGGGDSAMEEAMVLSKYASEVTVIHRRDAFKASEAMQAKVLNNPKIKVIWNTEVTEIKGTSKVEGLTLKNNQTGQTTDFQVDGVFVAIGHRPESHVFEGVIDLDEKGFVKISGGHGKTNIPGIFVAGDVMDPTYKQAATSVGSGCAAALDMLSYLTE
jgi:thioredoxin reductase (NADPH)